MAELTRDWKLWIKSNVERGCTLDSMIEVMVQSGFGHNESIQYIKYINEHGIEEKDLRSYIYGEKIFHDKKSEIDVGDKKVKVSLWHEKPLIVYLDGVLSDEECDHLIDLSRNKLEKSTVVDKKSGNQVVVDNRTSYGTYFYNNESDFFIKINKRISLLMKLPVENGEGLQVLNYQVGAEYKPHYDYFTAENNIIRDKIQREGQRVSTLVMYLNDVPDGGSTSFPELGLSVMPRKGSAVYFEYGNSLGQSDPKTLHSGDPVLSGEKWIATKWMRNKQYYK